MSDIYSVVRSYAVADPGGGGSPPPLSNKNIKNYFVLAKNVLSIFIYNIALQNADFRVIQKSSKHFLISIFFPPGEGGGGHPPCWWQIVCHAWQIIFHAWQMCFDFATHGISFATHGK